jgi:hypothetical protein
MGLIDLMQSDLDALLPEIGEEVIYKPSNGTPKTINAVIDRNPDSRIPEAQNGLQNNCVLLVSMSDCPTINRDGDKFNFSMIIGKTAEDYTVRFIETSDYVQWKIRVS